MKKLTLLVLMLTPLLTSAAGSAKGEVQDSTGNATYLVDQCQRRQYLTLMSQTGQSTEGLSVDSLPLEQLRANIRSNPATRKYDDRIVAGCNCSAEPITRLIEGARTPGEIKSAKAKIAKYGSSPAAVDHVKKCWASANAIN